MIATQPAAIEASPTRTIRIGDPDAPGEILAIRLRWLCPVPTCRRPRGKPARTRLAYHDASGRVIAHAVVDVWRNPCGHISLTRELIAEAAQFDEHQAAVRGRARQTVPRPRSAHVLEVAK